MISITVLFRLESDHVKVAIGSLDPDLGVPTWFQPEPIVGAHTYVDWSELVLPHVKRFAQRLGIDPNTLHGERLAYSGQIHAMMEFDFDSPPWTTGELANRSRSEFNPNDIVPFDFDKEH